jgi:hypothetical protein
LIGAEKKKKRSIDKQHVDTDSDKPIQNADGSVERMLK